MILSLEYLIHQIERLTRCDEAAGVGVMGQFLFTAEEMIELTREINRPERRGEDGIDGESVDLAICALAVYFASGGTLVDLPARMQAKLDKWEKAETVQRGKTILNEDF